LNDFEPRAVSNSRCSDAGSDDAAAAISSACASLNSPERNASSVSGNDSNRRAVSNVREAAPTGSPVASDNQFAAFRCSDCFQLAVCST
jgi:hypothetical protein